MGLLKNIFDMQPQLNPFDQLRDEALSLKAVDVCCNDALSVYCTVVDMHMRSGIATLVCVGDGTTSIYRQSGGGMVGLGHQYRDVAKSSQRLLAEAGKLLSHLVLTDEFSLPQRNHHTTYLLTKNGTYKAHIDTNNIDLADVPAKALFYLYQDVITSIRTNMQ